MPPDDDPAWHALDAEDVLALLDSRRAGLDTEEVEQRKRRFGPNSLPPSPPPSLFFRLLAQFNNALIYFLLAAAAAALILGHLIDAAVVLSVVLINAFVGVVQEGKAERALGGTAPSPPLPRWASVSRWPSPVRWLPRVRRRAWS